MEAVRLVSCNASLAYREHPEKNDLLSGNWREWLEHRAKQRLTDSKGSL
jgi:hypothetical protein